MLLLLGGVLLGQESDSEEEGEDVELPVEEALALIDQVCPLPGWDEEPEPDPVLSLLPEEGAEPDFELLRSLQLEDRMEEAEARVNAMSFGNNPIDVEEFFTTRENMFIRDPERFLTTREQAQLQGILISHAGHSPLNLHLNILEKSVVDEIYSLSEEKHKEILAGDEYAAIIYYFYDDPSRTVTFFSPKAQETIPEKVRKGITSSAIQEATFQGDQYQAVYRYLLDFTLQVTNYLDAQEAQGLVEVKETEIQEMAVADPVEEVIPPRNYAKEISEMVMSLGAPTLLGIVSGGLGLIIFLALHYWNKGRRVHKYPIADLPYHLSFPRARGCSGAMQFGKNAPSLKEQQDKLFS